MNKTFRLYGIIFIIIMVILAILEVNKTEVTDWRKNYDINEKTPFGLFVFNKEVDGLLQNKLSRIEASPYQYYNENPHKKRHNIFIFQEEMDGESWGKIFSQVSKGSDALIFGEQFSRKLADTLMFSYDDYSFEDQLVLKLTDNKFQNEGLLIDKLPTGASFNRISRNSEILGKSIGVEAQIKANFIKINFGQGHFYLHLEPLILTNYYLLKPKNEKYVEHVFSYLPDQETVWFMEEETVKSSSPMRFILSKPALKYAWWLLLAGLLLFVIFNAKRKQRIVPVIEPLQNKSAEFVKSIGNLYLQEGDFHDMMAKKAQYFLSKVRMDLMIDTQNLDENFAKKLQLKTGTSIEKVNEAIELIKKSLDPYASVMKEDLVKMNKLLDEILK